VLGTALAIKMIAYVTAAPVVGAFAAQLPRRAFLVTMDLVRAAITLVAAGLAASLWPLGDPDIVSHRHDDLAADHPHRMAHAGPASDQHAHAFVIDDLHARWPV
jgi:hypothetical protein